MFLAARIEHITPLPYARLLIRLGLEGTAARLNSLKPELATQFLDTSFLKANLTDRFLLSSWGTLTARMRPLLTETVIRSLIYSTFTPSEIIRSPVPITVYFRWPEKDLLALSPLVRLLWRTIIDEMLTAYDKTQGEGCHPVLLLVDEAGRTAIPMLADQATTVVGRKISLWIAVLRTSEYAHSQTERDGTTISKGLSEQGVALLTSREISQMGDTDVIGFHRNLPPMRLTRMDWRDRPELAKRRNMPPPALATLPPVTDLELRDTDPLTTEGIIDPDEVS
jgi:type IV secretory pathway TraG/TraD family ATPase VirD4